MECGEVIMGWFKYEQYENVGIFTFVNDISKPDIDELKDLLMQSIEKLDRVVLNFRTEIKMDQWAREMFKSAYRASERLKKPVIINGYRFENILGKATKRTRSRSL